MIDPHRPTIFTIVSRNYAAQAHVLMDSLKRHEPDADLIVVVSDGVLASCEVGGVTVVVAEELLPPDRVRAMSTYYSALEFNTALKPLCFQALFERAETVVYLDPDIRLYADLSPVWGAFNDADLLLTPHLLSPMHEGRRPTSTDILRSGVYNLGFLGLRRSVETQMFVRWWAERCEFDCRVDFNAGLFTDQRWVDLAPGFVERTALLRDEGLNVAYWNLSERPLARSAVGWTAGNASLRFFHFSGFDPARATLLSKHQDRISVELGSPLARLLEDYGKAMKAGGWRRASSRPYAFDSFPDGRPVTQRMRQAFWNAARAGRDLSGGLNEAEASWLEGLNPESIARGRPSTWAGEPWKDSTPPVFPPGEAAPKPWDGPAKDAKDWLVEQSPGEPPRVIAAFRRARLDLGTVRAALDMDYESTLLALCAGPEAIARRFAVDLLPADALVHLTDGQVLSQIGHLCWPERVMSEPVARLVASYGVAAAANWPSAALTLLKGKHDIPADTLWLERPDLQAAFDVRRWVGRMKLHRWFSAVAVSEYGLARSLLPPFYKLEPRWPWAASSKNLPPRPRGSADWMVCAPSRLARHIGQPTWYNTTTGATVGTKRLPKRIGTCIHYGELAEAALGWIGMHAQGVSVAQHVWAPSRGCAPAQHDDPAWSFVDAVWPGELWTPTYARPKAPSAITLRLNP